MENKETTLERFNLALEEFRLDPDSALDFTDICRERLGIPPGAMDELLLAELGMTGEEIIAEYRRKLRDTIGIGDKIY